MPLMKEPTEAMNELLRKSGDNDFNVAVAAQRMLAKALTVPLRKGVLKGDIVTDIYEPIKFAPGVAVEFPLDFLAPGTEKDHVAYAIPAIGRLPERHVEGDYIMVQTLEYGSSIDFALKYARQARWDVVGRALEVLEGSFVRKMNTDGWRVILASGAGRNLIVYDDQVAPGFFGKRVVELMKTVMRRQAGGNSTSVNRGKLTRLYVSPESQSDIRSWDISVVDDFTRREIFVADDYGLMKVFGVELRDLDELGVGQEFQNYYLNNLSGSFPTYTRNSASETKNELVVGLDMSKDDCFVMPVREEIELFEDPNFHRQRRAGFYGWGEWNFSQLDGRRTLLGAI